MLSSVALRVTVVKAMALLPSASKHDVMQDATSLATHVTAAGHDAPKLVKSVNPCQAALQMWHLALFTHSLCPVTEQ